MKLLATAFAGGFILIIGCGDASSSPQESQAILASARQDTAPIVDSKTAVIIDQIVRAYKAAPALRDTINMEVNSPMGPQTLEMSLALGSGLDATVTFSDRTFTTLDDSLYMIRGDASDEFHHGTIESDLGTSLELLFKGQITLPFHFGLKYKDDQEDHLKSMTFGLIDRPTVTGHASVYESDKEFLDVKFTGERNSKATIRANAETMLVELITLESTPVGAPSDFRVRAKISMKPEVLESPNGVVTFERGSRKEIPLYYPASVGRSAPDFTLPILNGESVTLSELKDSVIVLDFWATWCGPCRMALPKLEEFAKWAEASGKPIHVYAVNVLERTPSNEAKKKKVSDFWESKKLSVPTLMDYDNSVWAQFGFSGIPTTVVIAPDGTVSAIHSGFLPNMTDQLKKDVEVAFNRAN